MRRAAAVLAVLALAGADASAKSGESLYGVVGGRSAVTLVQLDPETLRPLPGRRLRLGAATATGAVVRAGDLAYADGYRLRLIDLATMKPFASVVIGPGLVQAVAWPEWQRILVMSGGQGLVHFVAVDRSVMKVTRRTFVRGTLIGYERTPTGLVLLVAPQDGIGPARLVIVDERARIREVALERVAAGSRWDDFDPPRGESRSPGLAVDPAGRVAYVATSDGLVAEIPLDGSPRYHAVRGSYAKIVAGSWRTAKWLGAGIIAVVGSDSADGRSSRPSGLELVDTRTWSSRMVLPGASHVLRWRDGVLATGAPWDEEAGRGPGIGVVSVSRDGGERFRLFAAEQVWIEAVTQTRAYVYAEGAQHAYVVDLLSGRIVAHVAKPLPWLLPMQEPAVWP